MTRKEQNKILDDKIESNNNQYKIDRLNAEISTFSSGDLNKYEFLKRIDLNYKPNALDKARFEFSPLGRAFNERLDKTIPNYQEEGVIKLLKEIRDNLAGGVNRPAGLMIRPGPPGRPGTPPPAAGTSINTRMPLPPIITTINTRLLPTPNVSLPTISTPLLTPISTSSTPISTLSQIPVPILTPTLNPLKKSKKSTPFNIKKPSKDPLDKIKKPSTDPPDNMII